MGYDVNRKRVWCRGILRGGIVGLAVSVGASLYVCRRGESRAPDSAGGRVGRELEDHRWSRHLVNFGRQLVWKC
jgi:hypothetical protein